MMIQNLAKIIMRKKLVKAWQVCFLLRVRGLDKC